MQVDQRALEAAREAMRKCIVGDSVLADDRVLDVLARAALASLIDPRPGAGDASGVREALLILDQLDRQNVVNDAYASGLPKAECHTSELWLICNSHVKDRARELRAALSASPAPPVPAPAPADGEAVGYMRPQDRDGNSFWCSRNRSAYYTHPVYATPPAARSEPAAKMTCDEQLAAAKRLASDLGYMVVPDPVHADGDVHAPDFVLAMQPSLRALGFHAVPITAPEALGMAVACIQASTEADNG